MFPVQYTEDAVIQNPWIREFLPNGAMWDDPTIKRNRERLNWWLDAIGVTDERFAYAEHEGLFRVWVYPQFKSHLAQPRHTPRNKRGERVELTEWVIENFILPDGPWCRMSNLERDQKIKEWNLKYEKQEEARQGEEKEIIKDKMGREVTAIPGGPEYRKRLEALGETIKVGVSADLTEGASEGDKNVEQLDGMSPPSALSEPTPVEAAPLASAPGVPVDADGFPRIAQEFAVEEAPPVPVAAQKLEEAAAPHPSGKKRK